MENPGISRAIPGAIIGFVAGLVIVTVLRSMQSMDPVWDPGVALVLTPFTMMAGWLWGIGAFNPKLSEHGEHHDEHDEDHDAADEDFNPMGTLMPLMWRVTTYSLLVIGIFYALATLPTGLFLQTVNQDEANAAAFASSFDVTAPLSDASYETTQMIVFLGFVAVTMISLLVFAGLIAFLFYAGHQQITDVATIERQPTEQVPPRPLRAIGRGAKGAARGLRKGLPKLLGYK